ncbi:hypothetical protein IFM89_000694 [Coptis chinensis]|uniref:Uncharacterized protein n=1 Tax=Coptis chinensis TaxID=261450 RepID=A0A835HC21_9MAGN|nr:hypothetical protein IFM89_000694 [Coptis chinensis]
MFSGNSDVPQKSLQIKQDDKFYSRLLSKESSLANPSLRVYYGGASGAIPFNWESQPGTPKNKFCDSSLPPLTPPPSFHSNSIKDSKKSSKYKLIHTIFPRLSVRKTHATPASPISSSPSWSSSMSSSPSTSMNSKTHRRLPSSLSTSSFDYRGDYEEPTLGSPTSTLCFSNVSRKSSGGFKGCYSMVIIKNAFSSMIGGHGSNGHRQGTA